MVGSRKISLALALLFLLIQGATLSHAASFGFAPHTHEGVLCTVAILTEDDQDDKLLPAPVGIAISNLPPAYTPVTQLPLLPYATILAACRGPPVS